jgi:hypothetical protein
MQNTFCVSSVGDRRQQSGKAEHNTAHGVPYKRHVDFRGVTVIIMMKYFDEYQRLIRIEDFIFCVGNIRLFPACGYRLHVAIVGWNGNGTPTA